MNEDQLETWMHNMIRACNRSTCDSDINVLKLIQHIENLYEKGRADEREACAKLCEEQYEYYGCDHIFAAKIRGRTEPKSDFKNQMDDNWAGLI
jgi:hypothetical protein